MPKTEVNPSVDRLKTPILHPATSDDAGVDGSEKGEIVGEHGSEDVLENIVAILDSLDAWQKSQEENGAAS